VKSGGTLQFYAAVEGGNSPAQSVTWSISTEGIASETTIDEDTGLLSVAEDETQSVIEVKAVSTVDTEKSGTGSVDVIGVTITTEGGATSVYQGRTLQFSATVEGADDQSVTWSISTEGIALGTGINASGLLSVAADENKTALEVKAVSTVYTNKSGTISIAIIVETDENNLDFGPDAEITTIDVTSLEQWTAAVATITNGGNDKNYIINVNAEVTGLTGVTAATFGTTTTGLKVSLRGTGSLALGETNGNLIRIQKEQTLILRDITLKGKTSNNNSVVYMLGASAAGTIQPVFAMESGEISGNINSAAGGGVYNIRGTFTMNDGEISNNSTSSGGGGVYNYTNGTFTMAGGKISGNINTSTSVGGGGVYNAGTFTMSGGEISGNTGSSSSAGGGGMSTIGTFTMSGGVITLNETVFGGGGVYTNSNCAFTMTGGTISLNRVTGTNRNGGGVASIGGTLFIMDGGEISGNTAENGGGVSLGTSTLIMTGGTISNNIATATGGGVYHSSNMLIMSGGTISGNTAPTGGGISSVDGKTFIKSGGTVYGSSEGGNSNTASGGDTSGHAVYVSATKYRNATAGTGVNLNSVTSGGWITN
jgi:hypothetical protein